MNNTIMHKEILSQKNTLNDCFNYNEARVLELCKLIKNSNITNVIVAARGSSDNACTYFKYLCEIYVGLPVSSVSPSVYTLYDGKLNLKNSLVIGVSQSGKAQDVLAVLNKANEQGGITVAITNDEASPLAQAGQISLFLNVGEEKSVAATKTFTAQMLALNMIVAGMTDSLDKLKATLPQLVELITQVIKLEDKIDLLADNYVDVNNCFILARGINLCAAQEISVKVAETCYVNARAFAISDFYHGPYALIDDKSHVIMLAFDDVSYNDAKKMLLRLKDDNANVLLFTNSVELCKDATNFILLPSCNDQLSPFVNVVCGQLFACYLSAKRGINPDSPRGLKKVTITK